jgi:DnaK suppressor protein
MATGPLSDAELEHFARMLRAQLAAERAELAQLTGSLDDVKDARSDSSADDEHDPEGPTLSSEWSRITGVHGELGAKVTAIEAALARIRAGNYGVCVRRGEFIDLDRLEARPAAELCIDCARELEQRR